MKYIMFFLLVLTLIFFVGCAPRIEAPEEKPIPADEARGVVITTDKTNYQVGDTFSISVLNNKENDIIARIFNGGINILKFDGSSWAYHGVTTLGCPCGAICEPSIEEIVINPKESAALPLNPPLQIETCTEDNQLLVKPLEKGRYKISLNVLIFTPPAPTKELFSNEFSVTE